MLLALFGAQLRLQFGPKLKTLVASPHLGFLAAMPTIRYRNGLAADAPSADRVSFSCFHEGAERTFRQESF